MTKNCVCGTQYLRNHKSYDCHLWCNFVKWWYLQGFFSILKFWFSRLSGGWKGKKWPKMTKVSICCILYFSNHILYELHLWKFRGNEKKTPEDIIILHMCTKNDNHMYSSWDIECDRQNFLSFKISFCCFTPLTTWKIKILKPWKKKGFFFFFFKMLIFGMINGGGC